MYSGWLDNRIVRSRALEFDYLDLNPGSVT